MPSLHKMYSCFITEGKILLTVLSAVRDGTSSQCEVPRDPRFPECPGKVDVSVSMSYFHFGRDMTESVLTHFLSIVLDRMWWGFTQLSNSKKVFMMS